jgi:hypothetical protein
LEGRLGEVHVIVRIGIGIGAEVKLPGLGSLRRGKGTGSSHLQLRFGTGATSEEEKCGIAKAARECYSLSCAAFSCAKRKLI